MKSITLPVFVGVYSHKHGTDVHTYLSREAVEAAQLQIAKDYWEQDRADRNAPEDYNELTDDGIIEAYFYDNMKESFEIHESSITLAPDDLARLLKSAA